MIDLVNLFAGLIDKKGNVNIDGFYDSIVELSDDEMVKYFIIILKILFLIIFFFRNYMKVLILIWKNIKIVLVFQNY